MDWLLLYSLCKQYANSVTDTSGIAEQVLTNANNILNHTSDSNVHVTASEKTNWNNKYTKNEIDNKIAVAKQEAISAIIGENVDVDFDTLQEIAAWIQSDTTNSAALINRVSAIEADYLNSTDMEMFTEKTTIITYPTATEATIQLNYNHEIRYSELTTLSITLPDFSETEMSNDYISSVVFTSGETATNLTYPETVICSGEDCIDGVFAPIPNKRYEFIIKYDGIYTIGVVGGISV